MSVSYPSFNRRLKEQLGHRNFGHLVEIAMERLGGPQPSKPAQAVTQAALPQPSPNPATSTPSKQRAKMPTGMEAFKPIDLNKRYEYE
ncbi:hypothetical protein [Cohaesibacter celericrescens]|uniref:hypothetical protein n=1 Tax=Cohaesibacter celericrescens TaxID=2067669 RepID=UPI0011AF3ACA|nr:hypothetical protein [Cohaesibacter celericrescens]